MDDIKTRISKLFVKADRENFHYDAILMGKKEYKDLKNNPSNLTEEEKQGTIDGVWGVRVVEVSVDKCLELVSTMGG